MHYEMIKFVGVGGCYLKVNGTFDNYGCPEIFELLRTSCVVDEINVGPCFGFLEALQDVLNLGLATTKKLTLTGHAVYGDNRVNQRVFDWAKSSKFPFVEFSLGAEVCIFNKEMFTEIMITPGLPLKKLEVIYDMLSPDDFDLVWTLMVLNKKCYQREINVSKIFWNRPYVVADHIRELYCREILMIVMAEKHRGHVSMLETIPIELVRMLKTFLI